MARVASRKRTTSEELPRFVKPEAVRLVLDYLKRDAEEKGLKYPYAFDLREYEEEVITADPPAVLWNSSLACTLAHHVIYDIGTEGGTPKHRRLRNAIRDEFGPDAWRVGQEAWYTDGWEEAVRRETARRMEALRGAIPGREG